MTDHEIAKTRYIALLRGINVGGARRLVKQQLLDLFAGLGFSDVRTYIQSGNVVFDAEDAPDLDSKISNRINELHGHDVPVMIRTPEQLWDIIDNNPYAAVTKIDPKQPYVAFLQSEPTPSERVALDSIDLPPNELRYRKTEVYLYYRQPRGKATLDNAYIERRMSQFATMRNWRTVLRLCSMCDRGL